MMKKMLLVLFLVCAIYGVVFAQPNSQGHYRWRNDDGTEETATWIDLEDTPVEVMQFTNVRLRVEYMRETGISDFDFVLYYHETNNVTDFIAGTKITADGSVNAFKLTETTYYDQDDNALDRLTTTEGYTHALGWCNELTEVNTKSLGAASDVEIEYCIQATANAVLDDSYFFSLRFDEASPGNGGVHYDTYNFVPELTITENTLPVELVSFNAVPNSEGLVLQWQTASEVDNLGFVLERRLSKKQAWQEFASYKTNAELMGQNTVTTETRYEFTDTEFYDADTIWYRLSNVDQNGRMNVQGVISVDLTTIAPHTFALDAAFPNPFNPETTIPYRLAKDAVVDLQVYDILGRPAATLVNNTMQAAGNYTVKWDGISDIGNVMSSGVYIIRLNAGGHTATQKIMLVK